MQITPTLLNILIGIYICAAAYHVWVATKKRQAGAQLSFSIVCLIAALYCQYEKAVYGALTDQAYLCALNRQVSIGFLFWIGVIWFAVYFADLKLRWFAIILSIGAAGLAALTYLLPTGIHLSAVHDFQYLRLPWGEQIAFPDTDFSYWAIVPWSYSLTVYVFMLYSSFRLWQKGRRRAALVLLINILSILSVAVFDYLIDFRLIHWMYLAEYRFLPCVFSMAVYTSKSIKNQVPETTV
ncbi:MAG: hypothetical protein P8X85_14595 [Desulfobacterales bacterium]